jgi:hypothetical protein
MLSEGMRFMGSPPGTIKYFWMDLVKVKGMYSREKDKSDKRLVRR